MNAIQVIHPYTYHGVWVFDDGRKDLFREPFVGGADEIIDVLTWNIPDAEDGFNLLFSDQPFPDYQAEFFLMRLEDGGAWYCSQALELEGWLCPALFKYFDEAPTYLYVKAVASRG